MKTKEQLIQEMKEENILTNKEYSFKEYVSQLLQFQDKICKMIAGDEYHERMRVDEALFMMESKARIKGLRQNPAVHQGILTMKELTKELAITMSGAKGEKKISKTLEFLERPNTRIFQNIYVSDGIDETELDDVVLTDEGIIILEVKKVKSDLTLTKGGRMVFAGNECYDKMPLADKMALKRKLLKKHLEKSLAAKGLKIPVFIDSYIVFSAPKGKFIHVNDQCHRDKHCFTSSLNKTLEHYLGYTYYKQETLQKLGEILSEMESNVKRFETELDYDEVRENLAEALVVLQNASTTDANVEAKSKEKPVAKQKFFNKKGFFHAACACLGLLTSSTGMFMGLTSHKI